MLARFGSSDFVCPGTETLLFSVKNEVQWVISNSLGLMETY